MKNIISLFFSFLFLLANAQEVRVMHYFPEGRDIVCLNGNNRYTRALYGSHSAFRLETSDRPVFATFDGKKGLNVQFDITYYGVSIPLEKASYCKAAYQGGKRYYILKDVSWGEGYIEITTLASFSEDNAIFKISCHNFKKAITVTSSVAEIACTKMNRNGDLGTDPRENFDAKKDAEKIVSTAKLSKKSNEAYLLVSTSECQWLKNDDGGKRFAMESSEQENLANLIEINTPNPFLNTLGANLTAAADGLWDGETHTWLHGCIGWRTPLAGWRAGYVGDVIGWNDRAVEHFNAYANSLVRNVPQTISHPTQDPKQNLSRGMHKWGTPMYSNGYICKLPNRQDVMNHYDMNLNYIDELLWHFSYDADTAYMRKMWPILKLHLEWEKRNFDPDGDHLYDAYCCIWASDALYYNSGAVTHSSAYNYRGNLLAARIAEIIGEDAAPYKAEAIAILKAMNETLWMNDKGCWAEFKDFMGLKRLHESPGLWTVYTPIDCEACTPEQAYQATRFVDQNTPHIPIIYKYDEAEINGLNISVPSIYQSLYTLSTTDWMPYDWSTNNVAHEEVANMALAYLQAGRDDSGYNLLLGDIIDEMYLGLCPGNFGQISHYDKARDEAYRDFGDNIGITSRAIINGLFGIIPDALNGRCILKPAFPSDWNEASIKTPYLTFTFHRDGDKETFEISQNFSRPLQIIVRANIGGGKYIETKGNSEQHQIITVNCPHNTMAKEEDTQNRDKAIAQTAQFMHEMGLDDIAINAKDSQCKIDISSYFNANADDIFKNEYLTPRSPYTTLELPKQGVGQWCVPKTYYEIEDDGLRAKIKDGILDTDLGLHFLSPKEGKNIIYTSLWDNYPDSVTIDLPADLTSDNPSLASDNLGLTSKRTGPASDNSGFDYAYLLLAGSTNNMQSRIANGIITANYADGSADSLKLENPYNWCPIEQDYYYDDNAFWSSPKHPYRISFTDGKVSRSLTEAKKPQTIIPCGAGVILKMHLNREKHLKSFGIRTLSNDVVIGLMGITLSSAADSL